ncbi:MAG: thymidine kinase [Clostridia bacterium]|nr:thymidine kinase [Clostridia bacterium]
MKGKIIVYAGPMFSEKSAELITAYGRAQIAHRSVLAFKPKMDSRFGQDVIKSRKNGEIPAINITSIDEIANYDVDVYIIDEFQFLTGDVMIIDDMANKGKKFFIAGLDKTAEGKPFGLMPELLAIADEVKKLTAVCVDCDKSDDDEAINSFYLGRKDKDIVIGNNEYVPLCRKHWLDRMNAKKKED